MKREINKNEIKNVVLNAAIGNIENDTSLDLLRLILENLELIVDYANQEDAYVKGVKYACTVICTTISTITRTKNTLLNNLEGGCDNEN